MWEQVKGFNQSTATTIKNLCLGNVQSGFGVPGKYPSAWEAWKHTQQHTGTPPSGVDVPVFFSYTATIDGITQNWGHIGVRLKDGRFWSDGTIYSSIKDYEQNHSPRYVGWGESVNNVRVIEQGEDMIQKEDLGAIRIIMSEVEGWNGHDVHKGKYDKQILSWVGKKWTDFIWNGWNKQKTHRINIEDSLRAERAKTAVLTKQVNELKAQHGNTDEATIIGKALLPILSKLGYKKG